MHKRAFAVFVALALVVTACGDDDEATDGDTSAETDDTSEGPGEGEQAADGEDFCGAYQELLAGDPTPEDIREVAVVAPEEGKAPLEELAAGFEADSEGFFETEEFQDAFAQIGDVANEECADDSFDVTAVEYEFEGMPSDLSPATYGVNLINEGEEFHEITVFRKADGVTASFDEIFAVDDPEQIDQSQLEEIGGTFAPPGGRGGALFELTEGEYIAVCFVPVGATPENEEADGQPHYTQGMQAQFSVG